MDYQPLALFGLYVMSMVFIMMGIGLIAGAIQNINGSWWRNLLAIIFAALLIKMGLFLDNFLFMQEIVSNMSVTDGQS